MESWVQSWRPRTNAFCDFSAPSKMLRLPIQSAAPVTPNHLPKTEDLMLQNATTLRKSASWPPNISDEHVSCIAPAARDASFQILFKCPTPAIVFETAKTLTFCSLLTRCIIPCACHAKRNRDNGVHFFDVATSKSAPKLKCFVHFDFEMCFATGMHFFDLSTSKSALNPSVFTLLTWKCASRHNGLQLFISHLTTWLRTRRFSEPTFRPSGATNHWKNTVVRDFPTFSRTSMRLSFRSFFWDWDFLFFVFFLVFSSLTLPISAFHLSILSEVWLLNFLRKLNNVTRCQKSSLLAQSMSNSSASRNLTNEKKIKIDFI